MIVLPSRPNCQIVCGSDSHTNYFIAEIARRTSAAKAPLGLPKNAATSRTYSGINVLILWGTVIEHGFPCQGWLTFRQALLLGGPVRKGWTREVADQSEHATAGIAPAERFAEEAKALRPLADRAPFGQLRDLVPRSSRLAACTSPAARPKSDLGTSITVMSRW